MRQSSAKPADGASNATGLAAIVVHTSHRASGCGTCAYWIGRPWRASPASICARLPMKRSSTRRGWPARRSTTASERPEPEPVARRQAPAGAAGLPCACDDRPRRRRWRRSGSGRRATASRRAGPRSSRRSADACQCRLAGKVAASLATTRSPGRNSVASAVRGRCRMRPSAPTVTSLADRRSGLSAAIMRVTPSMARIAGRQRGAHRLDDLGGGVLRALQRRAVGVGNRQRVQRRIHVAGVDREEARRRRPWPPRPRSPSDGASAALLAP